MMFCIIFHHNGLAPMHSIYFWMCCGILGEFICVVGGVVGKYITCSMGGCSLGKL